MSNIQDAIVRYCNRETKALPCPCTVVDVKENEIVFLLENFKSDDYVMLQGLLLGREEYKLCDIKIDNQYVHFYVPSITVEESSPEKVKWSLGLIAQKAEEVEIYRFKSREADGLKKHEKCLPVQSTLFEGKEVFFSVYETAIGNYAILQSAKSKIYEYTIDAEVTKFSITKGVLRVVVNVWTDDLAVSWKHLGLVHRGGLEEEKTCFEVPINEVRNVDESNCVLSIDADIRKFAYEPTFWDIRLFFEIDGEQYDIPTRCDEKKFTKQFQELFQDNVIKLRKGNIVFPYVTRASRIALLFRKRTKYDGFLFRLKERLIRKIYNQQKKKNTKKTYIIFEKFCESAQDNGYYFFRYCMEQDLEKKYDCNIYYVIDKKSPDYQKVKMYKKNVLQFMSTKFLLKILSANALISTDMKIHAFSWRARPSIIRSMIEKKKLVFLQHGVTAFKRVHKTYGKHGQSPCELFVVTSDFEKEIVRKYFGYEEDEIAVAGFARWDVLQDCSQNRRDVLMMPTWRNWLDSATEDTFRQSDYYVHYMDFLNSDRLAQLLEENDIHFTFYIHPKFKEYISNFTCKCDRVKIVPFGEIPLNQLMMECKLLITDYSSVAWDVYYQGKPVLFYQFDIDSYKQAHGSYIDMDVELFGERANNSEELIHLLENSIHNQFELDEKYKDLRTYYFKYIDDQNSQRIWTAIKEKNW